LLSVHLNLDKSVEINVTTTLMGIIVNFVRY
jgi:hypothetical protein